MLPFFIENNLNRNFTGPSQASQMQEGPALSSGLDLKGSQV